MKIPDNLKKIWRSVLTKGLKDAIAEQNLKEIYEKLEKIIPNIDEQYTENILENEYYRTKVRGQHAFQISLVEKALKILEDDEKEKIMIVDIGDSSGNHILYLKNMFKNVESLSVNLDKIAVEKIKNKGLQAVHARAEELYKYSIKTDIFLSFEMLEHLHDPSNFLRSISETNCKLFVITVPYIKQSRVGLYHIRNNLDREQSGESTHIFELSPKDWKLIFKHSGWEVMYEQIYLQYPKFSVLKKYYKDRDFEGFYGVILKPNPIWKNKYNDW